MWSVNKYDDYGDGSFSVQVHSPVDDRDYWVDVWINSYKDIEADWNQYIFSLYSSDDMERKSVQEDTDNFDDATGSAICYLEKLGLIYQSGDEWYAKRNEESN